MALSNLFKIENCDKVDIKLKRITIERDYATKRELTVELSSRQVSVIYGENGCGKTTMLKLFTAFLSQNESVFLQEKVLKYEVVYLVESQEKKVVVSRIENEEILLDEEGNDLKQDVMSYDWNELRKSELQNRTCILFGVNRGISNNISISEEVIYNSVIRTSYAEKFGSRSEIISFCQLLKRRLEMNQRSRRGRRVKSSFDLSDPILTIDDITMSLIEDLLVERYYRAKSMSINKVQKALFDTLADACDSFDELDMDDEQYQQLLLNNRDRLISALTSGERNTLSEKIVKILKSVDENTDVYEYEKNPLLKKLIVNMSKELNEESGMLQTINRLREIFNEYIGPDKYLEITEDEAIIKFNNSDDTHGLDALSSGEKHLLVLLTIFVIEGNNRDFFIVDEPEISLNMTWQRKLLSLLNELAPNAEIIVASHSPSIAKANSYYLTEMK